MFRVFFQQTKEGCETRQAKGRPIMHITIKVTSGILCHNCVPSRNKILNITLPNFILKEHDNSNRDFY